VKSLIYGVGNAHYMFREPTKRKEVKYLIIDDCWTGNLDLAYL
jgi:hypothetical protein